MKNEKIFEILNDPRCNKINVLTPVASKKSYDSNGKSLRINLNGEYKFNFCENLENRIEEWWNSVNSFDNIMVPSNIEFSGYGDLQYVNTQYPWDGKEMVDITKSAMKINYSGQYVREFRLDINNESKYHLTFEGVESCFFVWINGKFVGYNEDSFTTTKFDITDNIESGVNTIAVEVYKYNVGSWLNDQDFWRLSGIFRDVYIDEMTRQHIVDFNSSYDVCLKDNSVHGKVKIEKSCNFPVKYSILYKENEILSGVSNDAEIKYNLSDIKLWDTYNPNLYTVKLCTNTECFEFNVGYRKIELKKNKVLFNGYKLHIKGVNRHEFSSKTGRVQTYDQILDDLKLLKSMNVNSIRTSHYPNCNMFYELCDQLGFMIMDEVNLETHGTWMIDGNLAYSNNILPADNIEYRNRVLDRMKNMYYRDRNKTSVIFWSLGNESYGGQTIREMNDFLKENDNRLVHYEGVFWDRRDSVISDFESQMYTSSEKIEKFIENDDSKPFIACEYSHAMGNSNGNLEDYTNLFDKYENYHGGYIWEFTEQLIDQNGRFNYGGDFGDRPTDREFICDGIVSDYCRNTPERYYIMNVFSPLSISNSDDCIRVINKDRIKLSDVRVDHIHNGVSQNTLISTRTFNVKNEFEFAANMIEGINLYKFYYKNNEIKSYTIDNRKENINVIPQKIKAKFVDGDNNFGLYSEKIEIMFSKSKHALISYKYDGKEIFESMDEAFTPNFFRAYTNNDRGANKHCELGILEHISYSYSSHINKYTYENKQLIVQILFTNHYVKNYEALITYRILNNGNVKIELETLKLPTSQLFNFGVRARLSNMYEKYTYLGCGSYDTYIDRKYELPKLHVTKDIDKICPYVFPQEFGNHSDVSQVLITDKDGNGLKIIMDNYEFSLRKYSDRQLNSKRNVADLVADCNFLRINKIQTGVGGDDSWGSWAKEKYTVNGKNQKMSFYIEQL